MPTRRGMSHMRTGNVLSTYWQMHQNVEYQTFKDVRAKPIWDAIQRRAPRVVKGACTVEQVGMPLTHARFLNRHWGNYGLTLHRGMRRGGRSPMSRLQLRDIISVMI